SRTCLRERRGAGIARRAPRPGRGLRRHEGGRCDATRARARRRPRRAHAGRVRERVVPPQVDRPLVGRLEPRRLLRGTRPHVRRDPVERWNADARVRPRAGGLRRLAAGAPGRTHLRVAAAPRYRLSGGLRRFHQRAPIGSAAARKSSPTTPSLTTRGSWREATFEEPDATSIRSVMPAGGVNVVVDVLIELSTRRSPGSVVVVLDTAP